jgi:MMPL family protein
MRLLARIVTGRRTKWFVLLAGGCCCWWALRRSARSSRTSPTTAPRASCPRAPSRPRHCGSSDDPFEAAALDRAELLRERVHAAASEGTRVLVGDGSAVQADFNDAAARDLRLIVPLSLLVIYVILAVLLEALVAPLLLIGSVVVSFIGTLGLSILFFRFVVGDAGVDNSLPTYAFIFLVALGIDYYTIFLMSRVREEARRYGTREGTLRALAATGRSSRARASSSPARSRC